MYLVSEGWQTNICLIYLVEVLFVKFLLFLGVLETGLFVQMAKIAYFGTEDGKIITRKAPWNDK